MYEHRDHLEDYTPFRDSTAEVERRKKNVQL